MHVHIGFGVLVCFQPAQVAAAFPSVPFPLLLQLDQQLEVEVMQLEQKYNRLKQPIYARRNLKLCKIPFFWQTVSAHPQLLLLQTLLQGCLKGPPIPAQKQTEPRLLISQPLRGSMHGSEGVSDRGHACAYVLCQGRV